MTTNEQIQEWDRLFVEFRRKVYLLVSVGFALIIGGLAWTSYVYLTNQTDVRRVSCANSQSLVTEFEWLNLLASQNQSGTLTKHQIAQRRQFYTQAETLARTRGGGTCATLAEMRAQARLDIRKVIG